MAPVYRLKFFDFMGLVEPIRYFFAYGGIPYENVVVQKDADWVKLQYMVPFGKLPVLEVDQKVLYQSLAISRYLGKVVGLVPEDDLEAAELDAVVATVYDFAARVHDWYHEVEVERKAVIEKELEEEMFPRYLADLEEIIQKRGGYFGGKKISWADMYFVGIIESIEGMWSKDLLEKQHPLLFQLYRDVHNIPAINAYISKRPNYKY